MNSFRVIAISDEIAGYVREHLKAPVYGHPAFADMASGYGPCRSCLQHFRVGEERRLLFTYDAFTGLERLPHPGPVFIHEQQCTRYAEDGGFPLALAAHPLTLTAYAEGRILQAVEYVDGDVLPALQRLQALPQVAYIQVNDTEAGCHDFCMKRIS